jgi:acyl phosphate:glycerol-3-phosphate acyltransferase
LPRLPAGVLLLAGTFYLILTYLFASFPTGPALGRLLSDIDVREHGSGNTGATNVARILGKRLGVATLAGDMLKGLLPVLLAPLVSPSTWFVGAVALVAFAGHCWSAYLDFRGGKGVATAAGALLALAPGPTLAALVSWLVVVRLTRRASIAALIAAAVLPLLCWGLVPTAAPTALLLSLGVAWRHRDNVRRLRGGNELKI